MGTVIILSILEADQVWIVTHTTYVILEVVFQLFQT